jgi:hypothetical protein
MPGVPVRLWPIVVAERHIAGRRRPCSAPSCATAPSANAAPQRLLFQLAHACGAHPSHQLAHACGAHLSHQLAHARGAHLNHDHERAPG